MKPDILDKVNGWAVILRFILPGMVAIMLYWMGEIRTDVRAMELALSNHLFTDVSGIKERLASIEAKLP